jgi:hypothetical protein
MRLHTHEGPAFFEVVKSIMAFQLHLRHKRYSENTVRIYSELVKQFLIRVGKPVEAVFQADPWKADRHRTDRTAPPGAQTAKHFKQKGNNPLIARHDQPQAPDHAEPDLRLRIAQK